MKFKREYCFGGLNGKASEDDFVVAYHCENGKIIKLEFSISNQSFQSYIVDGSAYDYLKEAKAACLA